MARLTVHRFLNSSGILGGLSTKAKEYIHARDKKKKKANKHDPIGL